MTEHGNAENRISLAVVQNNVLHLVSKVDLLREEVGQFRGQFDVCRAQDLREAQERLLRIDRLEQRTRTVYVILGAVWLIILPLLISWLKGQFGL